MERSSARTARGPTSRSNVGTSLADDLARRLRTFRETGGPGVGATQAALGILDRARTELADTRARSALKPWWQEPPPILLCEEFLAAGELAGLRSYVLSQKDAFSPASLVNGETAMTFVDRDYRLSETLFELGPFRALFETRVSYYLDFVCARLDRPAFTRPSFEVQLTATRSGGFFRTHDDNSHPANRSRRLTFVYYFFLQPLRWSGGALRLLPFDARSAPLDVSPAQNRVVFFDSTLRHEVMPFVSGSDEFEAARFTVNGWVHQNTWP